MKKFFRFLLIIAILALLIFGGYYIYTNFFQKKSSIGLINTVPRQSVIWIETDNLSKAWTEIYNSDLWLYFKQNKSIQESISDIENINKFLDTNSVVSKFLKNRPLILSIIALNPTNFGYQISIDLQSSSNIIMSFKPLLRFLPDFNTQTVTYQANDNKYTIFVLENKTKPKEKYFLSIVANALILANDGQIIQNTLDQLNNNYWQNDNNFIQIVNKQPQIKQFKVYINYQHLSTLFANLFTTQDPTVDVIATSLLYSNMDLKIAGDLLLIDGFTNYDTAGGYIRSFANIAPSTSQVYKILSNQTAAYVSIAFDDYSAFYKNLMNEYSNKYPDEYKIIEKTTDLLRKVVKIDLEKDLFSWIGNEIAICKIRPLSSSSRQEDVAILINTKDYKKTIEGLDNIATQIRRWTPFRPISYNYKSYQINSFVFKGFFKLFFGKIFEKIDNPYYTIVDKYAVFANSEEVLQKIIDDFINGETIYNNEKQKQFIESFASKSNFNIFIFMPKMYNTILFYANPKIKKVIIEKEDFYKSFSLIGYQLTNIDKFFKTQMQIKYDNDAYFEDITQTLEYESFNDVLIRHIDTLGFKQQINATFDNGLYTEYYEDTKNKKIEVNLKNRKPDGICKTYYPNGNINSLITYHNGIADGSATFYYDNNTNSIRAEFSFNNDKIDGIYHEYYPDNKLKSEIHFKKGQKYGKALFYYKNGNLKISANYDNNQKDGKWEYYDENQNLIYFEKWRNGKRIK